MNTLHQYHWGDIETLKSSLTYMTAGDSLVIYGKLSDTDQTTIHSLLQNVPFPWHLVFTEADHIMGNHEINESQWLELIIQHNNCWSWK